MLHLKKSHRNRKKIKQLNYNTYGANCHVGGKNYKSQARKETFPM